MGCEVTGRYEKFRMKAVKWAVAKLQGDNQHPSLPWNFKTHVFLDQKKSRKKVWSCGTSHKGFSIGVTFELLSWKPQSLLSGLLLGEIECVGLGAF